jgi:hypothetical protein
MIGAGPARRSPGQEGKMDYARLVGEAWRLTWHHRFLWVLGLFAGGTFGSFGSSPIQWRGGGREAAQLPPGLLGAGHDAAGLLAANVGLVIAVAGLVVVLGLALLVISLISQGAVVRAAAELELGHPSSLRLAWRAGLDLFWRYVRLTLALVGLAVGIAFVVGAVGVLLFAPVATGQGTAALPLALLAAVALVPVLVVGGIALSIVVLYAQRAIALDGAGAVESLRLGWHTLRGHVGESLLAWVIALGLGVAAGVALFVLFVLSLAVVGGLGFGIWALAGAHPLTFAYAALGGLVMLVAGAAVVGIANTFFWNYWTLTYMQLHGAPERPAVAG